MVLIIEGRKATKPHIVWIAVVLLASMTTHL